MQHALGISTFINMDYNLEPLQHDPKVAKLHILIIATHVIIEAYSAMLILSATL